MPRVVDHEQRRAELSLAVWQVVGERGLDGLTLRAVAEAGGCTTGRVAHYFADKEALLAHARDIMHRRMTERIEALPVGVGPRERLRAVLLEGLPLDAERLLLTTVWAYFLIAAHSSAVLRAEHDRRHASWIERLTGLLRAAYPRPPADLDLRVRGLVALLDGLAVYAVTTPHTYPPELLVRTLDNHLDLLGVMP
ncbi:TetR/AcrR family transcriptional regulator [Catellatospora tritici]|uniref:TetR/AcrR family transcriptional regulator n=1 Tax=Catellatospora tritici TaxID=2851566 RepID=UPI001C2D381F|nr:TetR/AcrR family transcriptional regulator [Catellatospora tritici]MBV1855299.1 TetR family transcriptional regulator [Catellatospora tritici]